MKKYLTQIVIALNQTVNTILGGYADETLSDRYYRTERDGKFFGKIFRPIVDTLFFFEQDHCRNAYLNEQQRIHLPPEFRD